ncbi:MAG: adenylosuccinate synthetase [Planctomycetes bacterium]|nr:adenylosuccinate synthetase [Planctomycetota bacterium]
MTACHSSSASAVGARRSRRAVARTCKSRSWSAGSKPGIPRGRIRSVAASCGIDSRGDCKTVERSTCNLVCLRCRGAKKRVCRRCCPVRNTVWRSWWCSRFWSIASAFLRTRRALLSFFCPLEWSKSQAAALLSQLGKLWKGALDVLSELPEIKICVAYQLDGNRIDRFPSHADDLRRVEPIYEALPGWQQDITAIRKIEDLPKAARAYLHRISELIQRPIEVVSVGPEREQTMFAP